MNVTLGANYRYCEFPGPWASTAASSTIPSATAAPFVEYFDLTVDPYEMVNAAGTQNPGRLAALHDLLVTRASCKGGAACNGGA